MFNPAYTNARGLHDDLSRSAVALRARRADMRTRREPRGSVRATLTKMFGPSSDRIG